MIPDRSDGSSDVKINDGLSVTVTTSILLEVHKFHANELKDKLCDTGPKQRGNESDLFQASPRS